MSTEINLRPTATILSLSQGSQYIYARSWGIPVESKACCLLIHGLGAHSGWFEAFSRRLKTRGIYSLAPDLNGFGNNHNKFETNEDWLKTILVAYAELVRQAAGKPLILVGNSMGALLALELLRHLNQQENLALLQTGNSASLPLPDGVILMAPGFSGHPNTFTLKYQIVSLIQSFLDREKQIDLPYGVRDFIRDEKTAYWIENDPLLQLRLPGNVLLNLLKLTQSLKSSKLSLPCPLMLYMAGMDKIVDNEESKRFYMQIQAPTKSSYEFGQAYHDLTLDPCVEDLSASILDWVNAQFYPKVLDNKPDEPIENEPEPELSVSPAED